MLLVVVLILALTLGTAVSPGEHIPRESGLVEGRCYPHRQQRRRRTLHS